jgi:chorismate synthase
MAGSSFGTLFRFTTWGESHGPAIGCTGRRLPPRHRPDRSRHPGLAGPAQARASRASSPSARSRTRCASCRACSRATTGTPIADDREHRPAQPDYGEIAQSVPAGHADYTYHQKYGLRDYRGGGRSSARETASRVAAGGIARKMLA